MAERKRKTTTPEREWYDYARDPALALLKGGVNAGEALVGLADMATLGGAGWVADRMGYNPEIARAYIDRWQSPAQQAANSAVAEARGYGDTAGAMLRNPSTIGNMALELAPQVASAAGVGRRVVLGGGKSAARALSRNVPGWVRAQNTAVAGAAGEGLMGAGNTAAQVRREANQQGAPLYSMANAGRMAGNAALNAGIGYLGGQALRGLRFNDVDSAALNQAYAGMRGETPRMFGTGANRGVAASTGGEMLLENPAQQSAGDYLDAAGDLARRAVGGFRPETGRREEDEKKRRQNVAVQ